MSFIKLLSDDTINKIAAGEVVQRPASVVKELVENSIDAKAKNIIVEIKNGGKDLIRIIDDGIGIAKEDIKIAFIRHATSKISDIEDIFNIYTMGFRGEALASISSVSKLDIVSKTKESSEGIKLEIEGGNIINEEEVASNIGTTFNIKDLFFNVPARRKFLKSSSAETSAITDVLNRIALGNPEVRIIYKNNGKNIFSTVGDSILKNSIRAIFGKEIYENLVTIKKDFGYFKIQGFIGNNRIYRGNKNLQYVYINKRFVKSNIFYDIIKDAYKSIIPINKFAICFFNIDINPNMIDINIHPNKLEVKIDKEDHLKNVLRKFIKDELLKTNLTGSLNDSYINKITKNNLDEDTKENVHPNIKNENYNNFDNINSNYDSNNEYSTDNNIDNINKDKNINFEFDNLLKNIEIDLATKKESTQENQNVKETFISQNTSNIKDMFCNIDLEDFDENKKSIKFKKEASEDEIKSIVDKLIQEDLNKNEYCNTNIKDENNEIEIVNTINESTFDYLDINTISKKNKINEIDNLNIIDSKKVKVKGNIDTNKDQNQESFFEEKKENKKDYIFENLNIIGVVFSTYIIAQKTNRMYLIDQHAAHERILYEKYLEEFKNKKLQTQMLLDPIVLDINFDDMIKIKNNLDLFKTLGFEIEIFGQKNIIIRGVPNIFGTNESEKFIYEIIDQLETEFDIADFKLDKIASKACKSAIKAHDKIQDIQINTLINDLKKCNNSFTCPHGRPIIVEISKMDIEKFFKRII
ncbi:MAG: DNA mismatch repair endonuclease MutL [Peptostreptococcaceae bacterium]|jgi:DNA mismatch repair protein MutL|nr:DNA mismatch repair endonuclease MutL [Peptostreptococcaceae bacterium]